MPHPHRPRLPHRLAMHPCCLPACRAVPQRASLAARLCLSVCRVHHRVAAWRTACPPRCHARVPCQRACLASQREQLEHDSSTASSSSTAAQHGQAARLHACPRVIAGMQAQHQHSTGRASSLARSFVRSSSAPAAGADPGRPRSRRRERDPPGHPPLSVVSARAAWEGNPRCMRPHRDRTALHVPQSIRNRSITP